MASICVAVILLLVTNVKCFRFSNSLLSNCSYSYNLHDPQEAFQSVPRSIFRFSPLSNATLKVYNAGFGTTGTRTIHSRDIRKYRNGCHYRLCNPLGYNNNPFVSHFDVIYDCISGANVTNVDCDTQLWLNELRDRLLSYTSNGVMKFIGDNPAHYLFAELRNLLPDVTVQHTLRNPLLWAVKRICMGEHKRGDLMCDPTTTKSPNPFHILECVEGSKYVHDNIITTVQFTGIKNFKLAKQYFHDSSVLTDEQIRKLKLVAQYFGEFNAYVLRNVKGDRYIPLCLWDGD